jgi:hypothetical protein
MNTPSTSIFHLPPGATPRIGVASQNCSDRLTQGMTSQVSNMVESTLPMKISTAKVKCRSNGLSSGH